MVDHKDRNKLNNKKNNLEIVTKSLNALNVSCYKNNTSKCKGVTWDKNRNKWSVTINVNGKRYNLGRFENFEDAKNARIKAEKELIK